MKKNRLLQKAALLCAAALALPFCLGAAPESSVLLPEYYPVPPCFLRYHIQKLQEIVQTTSNSYRHFA